jgi:hypothetical protein
VFEEFWENLGFKFPQIMDDKAFSSWSPGHDILELGSLHVGIITSRIIYVLRRKAGGFFFLYII